MAVVDCTEGSVREGGNTLALAFSGTTAVPPPVAVEGVAAHDI